MQSDYEPTVLTLSTTPSSDGRVVADDLLGILAPRDQDGAIWQDQALCAQTDPDAFFPEKGGSTRDAKKICLGCEVRSKCLEYALAHDERFGIWGGLSERERRRVMRERTGQDWSPEFDEFDDVALDDDLYTRRAG